MVEGKVQLTRTGMNDPTLMVSHGCSGPGIPGLVLQLSNFEFCGPQSGGETCYRALLSQHGRQAAWMHLQLNREI
jgi:hypothetical protein